MYRPRKNTPGTDLKSVPGLTQEGVNMIRANFTMKLDELDAGLIEKLKGQLSGFWSRRINDEHRVVYRYRDGEVIIISCRFHY